MVPWMDSTKEDRSGLKTVLWMERKKEDCSDSKTVNSLDSMKGENLGC